MHRTLIRIVKTFWILLSTALACMAIVLAALLIDHTQPTWLPAPSGSFQVGRSTYTWVDNSRTNPYAPDQSCKEELAIWMWYPAAVGPQAAPSEYLPSYWRHALRERQGFVLSTLLSRDPSKVKTHSWADAGISPARAMYPVVLLRAGSGALSTDYTSLAEDLASHGYIVVSFDAPYRTILTAFPDGRIFTRSARSNVERKAGVEAETLANDLVKAWIADSQFVLTKLQQLDDDPGGRFRGKLDLQALGLVGHSLGGATSAQFCHVDPRCKAGIDIDGMPIGSVIQEGLDRPFFFILSEHSMEVGPETNDVRSHMQSIFSSLPQDKRWAVTLRGANHFSFSDQMLTRSPLLMAVLRDLGVLRLDKNRGLAVTSACVDTFFDVYLKNASPKLLQSLPAQYGELEPGIEAAFPRR